MRTGSIALLGIMIAAPAAAQTQSIQLRVAVAPNAEDARWKSGAKFEKRGECYRLKSAAPSANWPPAPGDIAGQGTAVAPLFNPGFAQADGSYLTTGPDDGFNTIFVPMTDTGGGQSMICRGSILMNGQDITARDGLDVSARTYQSIGSLGPMGVAIKAASARPLRPRSPGTIKLPAKATNIVTLAAGDAYNPETGERGTGWEFPDALRVDNGFLVYNLPMKMAPQTQGPSGFAKCQATIQPAWVHKPIIGNDGKPTGINAMCFRTASGRIGEATDITAKIVPIPNSQWPGGWRVESMTFKVTLYN